MITERRKVLLWLGKTEPCNLNEVEYFNFIHKDWILKKNIVAFRKPKRKFKLKSK